MFVEWTNERIRSKKHELISEMIRKCIVNLYLDLFHTHLIIKKQVIENKGRPKKIEFPFL